MKTNKKLSIKITPFNPKVLAFTTSHSLSIKRDRKIIIKKRKENELFKEKSLQGSLNVSPSLSVHTEEFLCRIMKNVRLNIYLENEVHVQSASKVGSCMNYITFVLSYVHIYSQMYIFMLKY